MNAERALKILRPSLALVAIAAALVILGAVLTGPAGAAGAATPTPTPTLYTGPTDTQGTIVKAGEDVVIPAGQQVDSVVTFGGDVTVNGSVKASVVTFGGDVTVSGSVGSTIVSFGGDVHLLPTAVVGTSMKPQDRTVVLFGATLTEDPGAQVTGVTQTYDNANWASALSWATNGTLIRPWWGFSLLGWIVQTAIFLVLGLVAAALMPRQLRAVQRKLAEKPAPSLGWGALTFFIIMPAVLVVLIISIVGLLLVIPYVVVVPLFYFFVITGVAAFVAEKVLAGTHQKDNLMLAVTLGVVGTTVLSRVPVAGGLLLVVMAVFGAGAAVLALADWRRSRKTAVAPAPAGAPGWPAGTAGNAAPVPATGAAPAVVSAAAVTAPAIVLPGPAPQAQDPTQAAPPALEQTAATAAAIEPAAVAEPGPVAVAAVGEAPADVATDAPPAVAEAGEGGEAGAVPAADAVPVVDVPDGGDAAATQPPTVQLPAGEAPPATV